MASLDSARAKASVDTKRVIGSQEWAAEHAIGAQLNCPLPCTSREASTTTTSANPATPGESSRTRRLRRTLYRGDPGMWSWVLHRITGATIFFFLFIRVLDTALVRISPQAYDQVIATTKHRSWA
jgi:hypothetical protein